MYMTPEQRLNQCRQIIDVVDASPRIASVLADVGIDAAFMSELDSHYETARAANRRYTREQGEQLEATEALKEAMDTADKVYTRFVRLARIGMKDRPGLRRMLSIDGRRLQTFSGWTQQVETFYKNALGSDDALAVMAQFNVTRQDLEDGYALLQEVYRRDTIQETEKSEVQQAREAHDAAMDAMDETVSFFLAVSKVAFEDDPQVLERFGVTVSS